MEARDASTVLLVRDAEPGLEVLLLQRNPRSDFVGGAHVFPGGAVDDQDREEAHAGRCSGRSDRSCSALLGLDRGGLAFWVAAVRECFEEAGVLLARRAGEERVLSLRRPDVAARFAAHRAAVLAGRPFWEVVTEEDLVLEVGEIHYVSHWITPQGASRRYDTRFFAAAAPPEQPALHDRSETVASIWITPQEALARQRRGDLRLVLPTVRNLEAVRRFGTVEELLGAAGAAGGVATVRPRLAADGVQVLLPGDPGYDDLAPEGAPA
jgi:8-oxo-dGTP pyrophosphatase MutT (NUDIX family)